MKKTETKSYCASEKQDAQECIHDKEPEKSCENHCKTRCCCINILVYLDRQTKAENQSSPEVCKHLSIYMDRYSYLFLFDISIPPIVAFS